MWVFEDLDWVRNSCIFRGEVLRRESECGLECVFGFGFIGCVFFWGC